MIRSLIVLTSALGLGALAMMFSSATSLPRWSEKEKGLIAALSLSTLGPVPPDPSNRVADDPRAVELGRTIFADARFSADGTVSCATCHQSERQFQDGLPLAKGVGTTGRRTMPIAGMAYSPFLFWDGRKDSLWSQALGLPFQHIFKLRLSIAFDAPRAIHPIGFASNNIDPKNHISVLSVRKNEWGGTFLHFASRSFGPINSETPL